MEFVQMNSRLNMCFDMGQSQGVEDVKRNIIVDASDIEDLMVECLQCDLHISF